MSEWSPPGGKNVASRLAELNQWQVEQQQKLRMYQIAQRELLDTEHKKILQTLKTNQYDIHNDVDSDDSCEFLDPPKTHEAFRREPSDFSDDSDEGCVPLEPPKDHEEFRTNPKIRDMIRTNTDYHEEYRSHSNNDEIIRTNPNSHGMFRINPSTMQLREPSPERSRSISPLEKDENQKPRPFLRRGEGLARFRMTPRDFKGVPKIYKDKKIKTYLAEPPKLKNPRKPEKRKPRNLKQKPVAEKTIPFKIYTTENRKNQPTAAESKKTTRVEIHHAPTVVESKRMGKNENQLAPNILESKRMSKNEKQFVPTLLESKRISKNENHLGPTIPESKRISKNENQFVPFFLESKKINKIENQSVPPVLESERLRNQPKQIQPEDPQIRMDIEIIENQTQSTKTNEEKLKMSIPKTPMKDLVLNSSIATAWYNMMRDKENVNEVISPENSTRQNEKELRLFEALENKIDDSSFCSSASYMANVMKDISTPCKDSSVREEFLDEGGEEIEEIEDSEEEEVPRLRKEVLQEYVRNFPQLKSDYLETLDTPEEIPVVEEPKKPIQSEMSLKVQRKALQDNVKLLLNWEGDRVKKKVAKKKVVKVAKPKKVERKMEKKGGCGDELIKELEQEINIFKRESQTLLRLQRECEEEKIRLERERRDFEKHAREEGEKLEAKISEEMKKLSREKSVFEKYKKQVKNQPSKGEREEIGALKREVERLSEVLGVKESRWGAAQARLRNQVKALEKENKELKIELETLKKSKVKRVGFEMGQMNSMNSRAMRVIGEALSGVRNKGNKTGKNTDSIEDKTEEVVYDAMFGKEEFRNLSKKLLSVKRRSEKMNSSDEKHISEDNSDSGKGSSRLDEECAKSDTKTRLDSEESRDGNVGSRLDGEKPRDSFHKTRLDETSSGRPRGGSRLDDECKKGRGERPRDDDLRTRFDEDGFDDSGLDGSRSRDSNPRSRLDGDESRDVRSRSSLEEGECGGCQSSYFSGDFGKRREMVGFLRGYSSGSSLEGLKGRERNWTNQKTSWGSQGKNGSSSEEDLRFGRSRSKPAETLADGTRVVYLENGDCQQTSSDGRVTQTRYYNGDKKEVNLTEGCEKYYYMESRTWHTKYNDGLEIWEFDNGQTERLLQNGDREVTFANGCVQRKDKDGREEWRYKDGSVVKMGVDGEKILYLANGEKEIHTKEYKRREFLDGTIKLVYLDGAVETRYTSGRVRVKDKTGKLVVDTARQT